MPGRCFVYRSTAAIRRRMAQENPAGELGQAGARGAGAGDGAPDVARPACLAGPAGAAELADGPLSTPQPASAVTARAAASAAARRAAGGGRDIQWRATGREHTSSRA